MIRSRELVSAAVVALAVLGLAVGHRLGAAGTARPVVRQTFVVTLDPDAPDFVIPVDVPEHWTSAEYDDSGWEAATSRGIDHVASGIPGTEGIWERDCTEHRRVHFRRRFTATADASGSLTIDCDNEYRAFLNGVLIGADTSWSSPETYDVSSLFVEGDNLLAVEGIDRGCPGSLACRLSGSFGDIRTDATWKVGSGLVGLAGSAWKTIAVPGLSRRSHPSFQWTAIRSIPPSSDDRLQGLWRADHLDPVTYARDGEVLVQLRAAEIDGGHHLVTPGTYRLAVDLVE